MPSPADLTKTQNEYKIHVEGICLWPKRWKTCNVSLTWHFVALNHESKAKVPSTTGVYSLVIQPGIAGHSACSYLMYIGKSKDLRRRFGDYLTIERHRRDKIVRLLKIYHGYIWFFYSKVEEKTLDNTEEELVNAFVPPCNSMFTGEVQLARGAF